MRTIELEMTRQRYMKKMRAGKLTGEELLIMLEIDDQLAEEVGKESLKVLESADQILKQAHVICLSEEIKYKEKLAKLNSAFRTFLDRHGLRAEFEAYWESEGEHNTNLH